MQFYRDGYRPGDPDIHPAAPGADTRSAELPDEVDVLIVGSGPAGTLLAAQLSTFPQIRTRLLERRAGPLELGQADGVACRTVETFEAFGLGQRLIREAYWVNETVFWRPSAADRSRIERTGRIQDTEDGLSEFPHVICNQARLQELLLEYMRKSPSRLVPDYGVEFVSLVVEASGDYPVVAKVRGAADGREHTIRARYVVGCDGARSRVRESIGATPHGDYANHLWGVMDVLAVTDFPDIRLKAAIQSAEHGNLLIIPREGGYLVRLYVDLGDVSPGDHASVRKHTVEDVIATARRVLHPNTLDVRDVVWFSVYEVGQRVTDRFDDVPVELASSRDPRVFICGDACHTHSAKAGQGMNVSMQDAFNLGWKLISVLEGRALPSLLRTYSVERRAIAQELIEFDKRWSKTMSSPPKDPAHPERGGVDPAELQAQFVQAGRYTAGVATRYGAGSTVLTGSLEHQSLAAGFPVGMRFHSAPVVRVADGKPMQLGHVHRADGAWRVYAFADASCVEFRALMAFLFEADESPVRRFTPEGAELDSVIEVVGVLQGDHRLVDVGALPEMLLPRKGRFGLVDYEKAYAADLRGGIDVFEMRGVDRERGAVVVVRPDQYVAGVWGLGARRELAGFFGGFLVSRT